VPRDWSDLFITADAQDGAGAAEGGEERRRGFFRRLRENLSKTRQALGGEIQATLFQSLDEHTWERLEEALIMADVGASTTASVVRTLESEATEGGLSGGEALSARLIELLAQTARTGEGRIDVRPHPTVILAVGVNGTGKTTTVGKLAWHLQRELGCKVLLAAADTFRAAATEQLEGWAQRAGCEIVTGAEGSDPGAVAFEAIARARSGGADVVLIDTAGRLHTQDDLMAELSKVRRVIARQLEGAPHETLLTVDATTGQNGLRQARMFAAAVQVTGVVLTKLDLHRPGRDRAGDHQRARAAREADRDRRVARGPAPVRPRGLRQGADRGGLSLCWCDNRNMDAWLLWVVAACLLGVGEMHTGGFFLAPFAVGAAVAAVVSLAGVGLPLALVVFLLASMLVLLTLRPLAQRHRRLPPPIRTGAAALVGRDATVLERIANREGVGCVKIDGEVWTARSYDEEDVIDAGERVQVVEIRGATALVMH
jgi:fused signal recognition particle receptor